METKPYGKHQLYRGSYKMDEGGEIRVPDKCYWVIKKYLGDWDFGQEIGDTGPIVLILNEDYKPVIGETGDYTEKFIGGFWSVISFLTKDEAIELGKQLLEMAVGESIIWHKEKS